MKKMPGKPRSHCVAVDCPKCGKMLSYESAEQKFNRKVSCSACGVEMVVYQSMRNSNDPWSLPLEGSYWG